MKNAFEFLVCNTFPFLVQYSYVLERAQQTQEMEGVTSLKLASYLNYIIVFNPKRINSKVVEISGIGHSEGRERSPDQGLSHVCIFFDHFSFDFRTTISASSSMKTWCRFVFCIFPLQLIPFYSRMFFCQELASTKVDRDQVSCMHFYTFTVCSQIV